MRAASGTLTDVLSPLSRAIESGIPLTGMLRESPESGQAELERMVDATRQDIKEAILSGAEGICYRLRGAEPEFTTPMEYGGFFLERDRELLAAVAATHRVLVCVEGGDEVYMDALEDLPGEIVKSDHVADFTRKVSA